MSCPTAERALWAFHLSPSTSWSIPLSLCKFCPLRTWCRDVRSDALTLVIADTKAAWLGEELMLITTPRKKGVNRWVFMVKAQFEAASCGDLWNGRHCVSCPKNHIFHTSSGFVFLSASMRPSQVLWKANGWNMLKKKMAQMVYTSNLKTFSPFPRPHSICTANVFILCFLRRNSCWNLFLKPSFSSASSNSRANWPCHFAGMEMRIPGKVSFTMTHQNKRGSSIGMCLVNQCVRPMFLNLSQALTPMYVSSFFSIHQT